MSKWLISAHFSKFIIYLLQRPIEIAPFEQKADGALCLAHERVQQLRPFDRYERRIRLVGDRLCD